MRRIVLVLLTFMSVVDGFASSKGTGALSHVKMGMAAKDEDVTLRDEAEILLAKARKLRSELEKEKDDTSTQSTSLPLSKWSVESSTENTTNGPGYRLYIDIGREEGTWMEPRWGSSGKRIELTLDVEFSRAPANQAEADKLVSDNAFGKKSKPYIVKSAAVARLRQGFDSMKCQGGAYRIDTAGNRQTIRFYVNVDGREDASFGDVNIPAGGLYFSLPCFGGNVSQLSSKEGIVTVRQMGWNTGWRREESRIVGIFNAKPIEQARQRDGF